MRYFRGIGPLFSRFAKVLYVAMLLVWSLLTIWRVASGSLLETPDASPTLIKIDLLEAVAFLAAWSLLLITLTTNVVNKGRDLEFATKDASRNLDDIKADMTQVMEDLPGHKSEFEKIQAMVSDLDGEVMRVKRESERVAEENAQLRKQLTARPTKDSEREG